VFWDVKLQEAVEYAQETDKLSGLHPNRSFPLSRIKQVIQQELGTVRSAIVTRSFGCKTQSIHFLCLAGLGIKSE
jgi:hypothetical protein